MMMRCSSEIALVRLVSLRGRLSIVVAEQLRTLTMPAKRIVGAVLAVLGCAQIALAQPVPVFTGLGDLPGGDFFSSASGVSDDGQIVVGTGRVNDNLQAPLHLQSQAFRWTFSDGITGLGYPPGPGSGPIGLHTSSAFDVSGDGLTVVGSGNTGRAIRWTESDGWVSLGLLPTDQPTVGYSTVANGVSRDGSIIVGTQHQPTRVPRAQAFRWTAADGMVSLAGSEFFYDNEAFSVSTDGSVIVGYFDGPIGRQAFRWTMSQGMLGLGDLPDGNDASTARSVNADGSVIVGFGSSVLGQEAFRWTLDGGMVGLGDLPGGLWSSSATDVNADGTVVIGTSESANGSEAFVWTMQGGTRSLADILTFDCRLDLTGWTLVDATGVSADGRTIVGNGINPLGQNEAFIAIIPAPGAAGLLGLAVVFSTRRQRAHRTRMQGPWRS